MMLIYATAQAVKTIGCWDRQPKIEIHPWQIFADGNISPTRRAKNRKLKNQQSGGTNYRSE